MSLIKSCLKPFFLKTKSQKYFFQTQTQNAKRKTQNAKLKTQNANPHTDPPTQKREFKKNGFKIFNLIKKLKFVDQTMSPLSFQII